MTAALAFLVSALFVLGCSRRAVPAPVVEIGAASTSSMGDVSPRAAGDASAPGADLPPPSPPDVYIGSCEAQGFEVLEACPGGHAVTAAGGFDMVEIPELLHYCCATGPLAASRWDGCFNTLEAAMVCGDKAGIDAANAKIMALARAHGEPCKTREVREFWKTTPRYKRLCALRGYP